MSLTGFPLGDALAFCRYRSRQTSLKSFLKCRRFRNQRVTEQWTGLNDTHTKQHGQMTDATLCHDTGQQIAAF